MIIKKKRQLEFKQLQKFPQYLIYEDGRIMGKQKTFLKPKLSNGYYGVNLTDLNNKKVSIRVHILVATAFIENPNPIKFKMVDHIDNNKLIILITINLIII